MQTNCQTCGGEIPSTKKKTAVYCSKICRTRAAHYRHSFVRKAHDEKYRERKATGMTREERAKMQKALEREETTARHLRELQPITRQWQHTVLPTLGAEYNIY